MALSDKANVKQCIRSGGGGKTCFKLARGPPSDRIHCCWTEPAAGAGSSYRGLSRPSVCLSGRAGTGGRRSRARRVRRARSILAPPHNLTPLHHSPSPPHQSHLSNLAPPHQRAPFPLPPSHLPLLTSHFHPPGAIPGPVQPQGHWLALSSQPCTPECSPLGCRVRPVMQVSWRLESRRVRSPYWLR